jgi:hypothetical protein
MAAGQSAQSLFASQWEAADETWSTAADMDERGEQPKLVDGHHKLRQPNGDVYEGGVANQMRHGRGLMQHASGNRYEGDFVENKRHGRGRFTYADGSWYDGEWAQDEKCGQCVLVTTGGDRFEGTVQSARYQGNGSIVYADGREYRGEFDNGQRHGRGVLKMKNGDVYDGEFHRGKQTGSCVITYASKRAFTGVVEDAKKVNGEMAFPDGKVYSGEWKAEKPDGRGICRYKNGDAYEGEWANGRLAGRGRMVYADGREYDGEWQDDKYHGEGVAKLLSGRLVDTTWAQGKQIGQNRATEQKSPQAVLSPPTPSTPTVHPAKAVETVPQPQEPAEAVPEPATARDVGAQETSSTDAHVTKPEPAAKAADVTAMEDARPSPRSVSVESAGTKAPAHTSARALFASQWEAADETWSTAADMDERGEQPKLVDGHHKLRQPNGDVYEGGVANQMRHGRGLMQHASGNRYEGDFVENKRHGRGRFTYADGSWYDGEWAQDEKCGQCVLVTTGGDRFEGTVQSARYQGNGSIVYADGREYRGEFDNGQRHGRGVLKMKNGDVYDGEFHRGKQTGSCVITYASKRAFTGVVEDAKKVNGEMAFPDGKVYSGEWKAEKPDGRGICRYKNGDAYEGEWANGRLAGRGRMVYADGREYDGEWQDDKYHGEGVAKLLSGRLVDTTWAQGKQIGQNRATEQKSPPKAPVPSAVHATPTPDVETPQEPAETAKRGVTESALAHEVPIPPIEAQGVPCAEPRSSVVVLELRDELTETPADDGRAQTEHVDAVAHAQDEPPSAGAHGATVDEEPTTGQPPNGVIAICAVEQSPLGTENRAPPQVATFGPDVADATGSSQAASANPEEQNIQSDSAEGAAIEAKRDDTAGTGLGDAANAVCADLETGPECAPRVAEDAQRSLVDTASADPRGDIDEMQAANRPRAVDPQEADAASVRRHEEPRAAADVGDEQDDGKARSRLEATDKQQDEGQLAADCRPPAEEEAQLDTDDAEVPEAPPTFAAPATSATSQSDTVGSGSAQVDSAITVQAVHRDPYAEPDSASPTDAERARSAGDVDEAPTLAAAAAGCGSTSLVSTAIPARVMTQLRPCEGFVEKYSVGKSFFAIGNWKKRHFTLDETGLSYREVAGGKLLGSVPVGNYDTRLITRPTKGAHKKATTPGQDFVIVYYEGGKELRLLMRALSSQDHGTWVEALSRYIETVDDPRDA